MRDGRFVRLVELLLCWLHDGVLFFCASSPLAFLLLLCFLSCPCCLLVPSCLELCASCCKFSVACVRWWSAQRKLCPGLVVLGREFQSMQVKRKKVCCAVFVMLDDRTRVPPHSSGQGRYWKDVGIKQDQVMDSCSLPGCCFLQANDGIRDRRGEACTDCCSSRLFADRLVGAGRVR